MAQVSVIKMSSWESSMMAERSVCGWQRGVCVGRRVGQTCMKCTLACCCCSGERKAHVQASDDLSGLHMDGDALI